MSVSTFTSSALASLAQHCPLLSTLHLFFCQYINTSTRTSTSNTFTFPSLEGECCSLVVTYHSMMPGLYLGVAHSCGQDLVHSSLLAPLLVTLSLS